MTAPLSAICAMLALAALTACSLTDIAGSPAEQREAAERAATEVAKSRFPGLPSEPIAQCVVENASKTEVTQMAEGAARGISGGLSQQIFTMAQRPETRACIADKGVQDFAS